MKSKNNSFDGLNRFNLQIEIFENLLQKAAESKEPAVVLFQSNARQALFCLEALARIYKGIHNKKRFERMRLMFKSLEDQLGKIDYYYAYINEFSAQKNFPDILLNNLNQHYKHELLILESMLLNDGWLNENNSILAIIKEELETADWLNSKKEKTEIGKSIIGQIEEIEDKYDAGILNFNDLEHGLHEFRRQLRWISIYAQALNGLVQLKIIENSHAKMDIYLTKEVILNPYNKMPPLLIKINPIIIQSANFYSLSWLITESGNLKDEGLRIICIENAIKETALVFEKDLKKKTKQLAINNHRSPRQIKEEMEILADNFIHEAKVLHRIKRDIKRSISEMD
jgi:hypothetical protein